MQSSHSSFVVIRAFSVAVVLGVTALAIEVHAQNPSFAPTQIVNGNVVPPSLGAGTVVSGPVVVNDTVVGPGSGYYVPPGEGMGDVVPPAAYTNTGRPEFGFFGEFMYIKPRNANVPFGVPQDGLGIVGSVPTGPVGTAEIGFNPGFRVGAFVTLAPDLQIQGSYTWYDSQNDDSVSATPPNVVNPLLMFPGTFNAGFNADQATSDYSIDYQIIDLDGRGGLYCCERGWFAYIAGVRYAELEQDLNVVYPFAPPDGQTALATNVDFVGIGPRFGLEGERIFFPRGGLRMYGKGVASFLVGQFEANYTQTNQFNGVEVNTSIQEDRIVPVLDFELGIAWVSPQSRFRVSAGYMVSAWFNTVTTPGWVESVQQVSFLPGGDTLTFDGLTARAEVRF